MNWSTTVSYRDSHKQKGADYHETFAALPHRKLMWQMEQDALRSIIHQFLPGRRPSHLDFACGTGRILGFLAGLTGEAVGVDIADSMLAEARANAPNARLLCGDVTRDPALLGDRKFDLITAFRFFPNAEPELRHEVMGVLVKRLNPGGVLVFNNHMNASSLMRKVLRVLRGYRPTNGMSVPEVREMVGTSGLGIRKVVPLCVLPIGDRYMPGPFGAWRALEGAASSVVRSEALAQDNIYVCGA